MHMVRCPPVKMALLNQIMLEELKTFFHFRKIMAVLSRLGNVFVFRVVIVLLEFVMALKCLSGKKIMALKTRSMVVKRKIHGRENP